MTGLICDGRAFQAPFRVRFDEAGADGHLRMSSALRYAQDLAWQHTTAKGFDRAWYAAQELTWLVRAARLEIRAPIGVGSTIGGVTEVVGMRRVWSRRRSTFSDPDGVVVAVVDIDWVLLDGRGLPARIPPVFESLLGADPRPVELGRVALGEPASDAGRIALTVRPQELDPLDHVNNAVYADWLDEAVIAAGDTPATRAVPRLARLEYASAAGPSEAVDIVTWRDPDGWSVRVDGPDGVVRLRGRLESA